MTGVGQLRLFQAGVDGEDINQAGQGENPDDQLLGRGQQQGTTRPARLLPGPGQRPQAAASVRLRSSVANE